MKNIVLHIEGGIGKNIAATALVAAIKMKHTELDVLVVTAWDEVWIANPHVRKVFNFQNTQYFYDDYIKGKAEDTIVVRHDPYHCSSYIFRQKNLLDAWASLFPFDLDKIGNPVIQLNEREKQFAKNLVKLDDRPIFVIHPSGGFDGPNTLPYSWARDIPPALAQEVINRMTNKGYRVIQLGRPNQREYQNAELLNSTLRIAMCVLQLAEKRLLIDSFAQHAAAALGLPSTVLWIANKPEMLGYDLHDNLVCDKPIRETATRNSYLEPFNILGALEEFPYDTEKLFDVEQIMGSLVGKKQNKSIKEMEETHA